MIKSSIGEKMHEKELKIIQVAIALFNKTSYTNVGINKIIQEADVAKMTFYKYFPSKMILIEKCIKYICDTAKQNLETLIENENNALNKLKSLYKWYDIWFCSENFYGCLLGKVIGEYPDNLTIRKTVTDYKLWFINFITMILDEMKLDDNEKKAFKIVIVLEGATSLHNIFKVDESLISSWEIIKLIIDNKF